ncbi:MAG: hypothetical protein ACJ70W_05940 [Nitrososphaera sp.]
MSDLLQLEDEPVTLQEPDELDYPPDAHDGENTEQKEEDDNNNSYGFTQIQIYFIAWQR